ncbi:hypothetical protein QBA54_31925 [Streptomyces sp. B21-108]|uniref:hypothetical protein n=1 Tax=Streptomyces sp. B21-108 TaxID=3039419 RepID=UPI002FF1049B
MPKSQRWRVCSTPGCPEYTQHGKCDAHRRAAEQRRGSARQRGYDTEHETLFRRPVLARDPTCVCTDQTHGHDSPCGQPSKHADHYPHDRRALAAARAACVTAWADVIQTNPDAGVEDEPGACDGLPEGDRLDRYMDGLKQHNQANRDKIAECADDPSCTSVPLP